MWGLKGKRDLSTIAWETKTGETYSVWVATDPSNWIVLPGAIAASGAGLTSRTDNRASGTVRPPSDTTASLFTETKPIEPRHCPAHARHLSRPCYPHIPRVQLCHPVILQAECQTMEQGGNDTVRM